MDIIFVLKLTAAVVATVSAAIGALAAYNKWRTWSKRRLIAEDISADVFTRQFNNAEIDAALRGYLIPSCSPADPTNREGEEFLADTRESIFSYLDRNIALPQRTYHLLLADTGMGKTVFSMNYFSRCKIRFKSNRTCLVSLNSTDADSFIKSVPNKPNTILIADALDEDPLAIRNGRDRLSNILELSADFKAVIITCRSQFFLSDDAIPRETPLPILIPRKLGQQPNFSLIRSYISPFSPEEVRRYINKNFPVYMFWKHAPRKRALDLLRSIPDLAHRPMLLERLPEIAKDKARSSEIYDLYDLLVESWISRESRWINKDSLKRVSLELALYMYSRIDVSNGRHSPEEIAYIAESRLGVNPDWAHLTTRSLLNRDSRGNFKFAHKSILEFLVVFAACNGDDRALNYTWTPFMKEIFISWGHTGNYVLDYATWQVQYVGMVTNITDPIFHDEAKALAHIEASRWNGEPYCGQCGSVRVRRLAGKMVGYFQCNDCRVKFTVRTGTIMERSHVPLHKWLLAFHLMAASKKGMSAKQMERMLGVTYKTAWFLCHRVREAMDGAAPSGPLGGPGEIVEADETYVGGKAKNRAYRAPAPKKPVVALVHHTGHVKSFHVANVTAKNVRPLLVTHVDRASHLITDESPIYTRVGREFVAHSTVNHSAGQYVTGGGLKHTNTVEGFFSIFKRGVIGTYHHMSEAHLGRYCAEFDLRYNTRELNDGERAALMLKGGEGRRLTYRRTDKRAA